MYLVGAVLLVFHFAVRVTIDDSCFTVTTVFKFACPRGVFLLAREFRKVFMYH